jgi:hypothetical protein
MIPRPILLISETDIEAALGHLRDLPHAGNLPWSWHRKRLLDAIRDALPPYPLIGGMVQVAHGVFASVQPFGWDMTDSQDHDNTDRMQVVLAIRSHETDPKRMVVV